MVEIQDLECRPVTEQTLLDLGIITKDKLYKYPLRYTNLQLLLKVYAVITCQPFTMDIYGKKGIATEYYTTDYGLAMLYNFFRGKDLKYARCISGQLFTHATQKDLDDIENYKYFSNFKGTVGVHMKSGSRQKALIIRTVNRTLRKYEFDSISEAREQLSLWLTVYPSEQFTLYRVRTKNGYTIKEKIPLLRNVYHPTGWNGR